MSDKPTVFISYSRADKEWKERLVKHLGVLKRQGLLDIWDDSRIAAGESWKQEIEKAIDRASVVVLLLSADFLSSEFVWNEEIPRILRRRQSEGLRILPLLLKPCDYDGVDWICALQRPLEGRALSACSKHDREAAFAGLAKELREIAKAAAPAPQARAPAAPPASIANENDMTFLAGVWRSPQGSTYCVRWIQGALRCVYSVRAGNAPTGEIYGWRSLNGSLLARFRWFDRPNRGYFHLRVLDPDRLEGGWWREIDVPDPERLPNVAQIRPTSWAREPSPEMPPWAIAYFQELSLSGASVSDW
ncbi:MAG TPA: toll/interleukin-1 receptor domain-containing protein [Polyangiaceae bacterium]|nr:toll/interleukin-1 receptor domain-containing protein [Polyangiaceae bacterium]